MDDFTLEFVWDHHTSVADEVIRFWLAEGAMDETTARQRATLLLAVCRNEQGQVVGVATGAKQTTFLQQPLMLYRTFVGRTSRRLGLARRLLAFCFAELEARHDRNQPVVIGVLLQYPAELARIFDQRLEWPELHFTFVGRTSDGHHRRLRYFEDTPLVDVVPP